MPPYYTVSVEGQERSTERHRLLSRAQAGDRGLTLTLTPTLTPALTLTPTPCLASARGGAPYTATTATATPTMLLLPTTIDVAEQQAERASVPARPPQPELAASSGCRRQAAGAAARRCAGAEASLQLASCRVSYKRRIAEHRSRRAAGRQLPPLRDGRDQQRARRQGVAEQGEVVI